MLTVHMPKAIHKCWAPGDTKTLLQVPPCNILHTNFFINSVVSDTSLRKQSSRLCISSGSWKCYSHLEKDYLPRISNRAVLKKWLCRSHISASSDDEYRSSRNIAVSLFRRYRNVIDRGGGDNLKEFISAGVNAYALGCTEEGLRKELIDMKDSGAEIEGLKTYGGSTSLKSKILSEEVDECILWLSILFITILCTPQPTVVRWSSTSPVSDEILLRWKGFCALIANAYYIKGMAWLPVKTLQLEQMAVVGHAEEPAIVASRMQLVFTTLEMDNQISSSNSVEQGEDVVIIEVNGGVEQQQSAVGRVSMNKKGKKKVKRGKRSQVWESLMSLVRATMVKNVLSVRNAKLFIYLTLLMEPVLCVNTLKNAIATCVKMFSRCTSTTKSINQSTQCSNASQ